MKPDDFNLIKVIGRGAFGEVQLVSTDESFHWWFVWQFMWILYNKLNNTIAT